MNSDQHVTGWRKSSRSGNQTDCVEVGRIGSGAAVRDTKDRAAGYFATTPDQWANFVSAIKSGRFSA
ncbi:DUF397 domain-containing protein [Saccharopolyspora shandongensis]|uniref:DUF397 domain-containing protein n=1 Tax=Saccharopolyspora shandongensis TaxID=418495 RepID=UPI0033CA981E